MATYISGHFYFWRTKSDMKFMGKILPSKTKFCSRIYET
jgi:hypothetical protein